MTAKHLAVYISLISLWLYSVSAVLCLPPYPVGSFNGGYCGPQQLPVGVVDEWDFSYAEFWCGSSWFRYPCFKTYVNKISFRNACLDHDNCYDDFYADPTNCDKKVKACNTQFDGDLARQCSKLPKSCQRGQCYDVIASAFNRIVEAAEDFYVQDAGC